MSANERSDLRYASPSPIRQRRGDYDEEENLARTPRRVGEGLSGEKGAMPESERARGNFHSYNNGTAQYQKEQQKVALQSVQRTPERVFARTTYEGSYGRRTPAKGHDIERSPIREQNATPGRSPSQVPATPEREQHYTNRGQWQEPQETPGRLNVVQTLRTPPRGDRTPPRGDRTPPQDRTPPRTDRTPPRTPEDRNLRRDEPRQRSVTPPPELRAAPDSSPFRSVARSKGEAQLALRSAPPEPSHPAGVAMTRSGQRTPGAQSNGSGHTNSTDHQNLVCTNCVNNEIADDKKIWKEKERETDAQIRLNAQAALQDERARESEFRRRRADVARDNANYNRDVSERRRREEMEAKKKELPLIPLFNEELGEAHRRMLHERKREVREELIEQIHEKRARTARDHGPNEYLTGLPIEGNEDPRRKPMTEKFIEGLKEQVEERERQKHYERQLDRELADKVKEENTRYEREIIEAKRAAEVAKKERLRKEMSEAIEARKWRKDDDKEEEAAFKSAMDRAAEHDRQRKLTELAERKEREQTLRDANKKLIEFNTKKREEVRKEDKESGSSLKMVCPHRNKLYACCICNRQYPRNHLSKRYYNN